jgi:hypothetical protein
MDARQAKMWPAAGSRGKAQEVEMNAVISCL